MEFRNGRRRTSLRRRFPEKGQSRRNLEMKVCIRYVILACASLALCGTAKAQDFYWNTASVRSNGLGGIYVASSSDVVDALAANPAGLAVLRGGNLDLAVDTVFARGSFSNSVNT